MANTGIMHMYTHRLFAFEHSPFSVARPSSPADINTLLWIGGLGDGILTVRYPKAIAAVLPPNWVLAEVLLSSSYKGWATGSLKRDARELGNCVKYFKQMRSGGKNVLMGHSTGCQDVMEYLVGEGKESRESIDGAILQAGVSDREGWDAMAASDEALRTTLKELVATAVTLIHEGKEQEVMQRKGNKVAELFGAPITAYRLHSLLTPGGDDDYFSSDLSDSTLADTFGKIPKESPVMFLWGELDPYVPAHVNKEGILKRWMEFVRQGGGVVDDVHGGIVKGAHHNLNDDPDEVVRDLTTRVVGFLKNLEGGLGSGSRL